MPIARFSVQSAAADRHRTAVPASIRLLCVAVLALAQLALQPGQTHAQQPLRIGAAGGPQVAGAAISGTTMYPVRTLELLGFRVSNTTAVITAVLGTDTLRFFDTSPFFRGTRGMHQLAYAATIHDGTLHLPEQFFIQWLPTHYPDRFEYRTGILALRPGTATTVAAQPPPPPQQTAPQAAERSPQPAQRSPQPAPRSDARQRNQNPRLVVIDPGHGGRDPGKVGPNGLAEKEVTLMIAQRLASVLRDRGYEVHLTRTTDTYVPLQERPKLANRWKGDRPVALFLSIHANSAPSTAAKGFETFFLSEARTDDERRVAEMENEAIQFDDHGPSPAEGGLDHILNTLRSDFLMRASHDLAAVVQEKLAGFHPGPNRGVKRAGFYVLVGAIMPAVLIETAFISNRDEAALLGTQAFQQKIAWGIADSVDEFFKRNEHLWVQEP